MVPFNAPRTAEFIIFSANVVVARQGAFALVPRLMEMKVRRATRVSLEDSPPVTDPLHDHCDLPVKFAFDQRKRMLNIVALPHLATPRSRGLLPGHVPGFIFYGVDRNFLKVGFEARVVRISVPMVAKDLDPPCQRIGGNTGWPIITSRAHVIPKVLGVPNGPRHAVIGDIYGTGDEIAAVS